MKFGRNLPRNQVPEWASFYINYKGLKKLIKVAAHTASLGEKVDLAELFFALDRNLEDVDSFYNKKFAETHRRLNVLQDIYGRDPEDVARLDQDEVDEVFNALLELRNQLRNLMFFGEINRRGFIKITKKLDKKVPQTLTQDRYITTKVDPRPFAKDHTAARMVTEINKWLSILGPFQNQNQNQNQAQNQDDAKSDISARSTRSLGRTSVKGLLSVPSQLLETLEQCIRKDDVNTLQTSLVGSGFLSEDPSSQALLLNFLQRSISNRSKGCIAYLLEQVKSLGEPDDLNERNCIHRLVINIGRTRLNASEPESNAVPFPIRSHFSSHYTTPNAFTEADAEEKGARLLGKDDEAVQILMHVLDLLQPQQRSALVEQDHNGRIPLHYAAQLGFVVLCEILMAKMQDWDLFNVENGIDAPEWQDSEGNAPLHLAVMGGHTLTVRALLRGENWRGDGEAIAYSRGTVSKSSIVLSMATASNFTAIVKMLVKVGVDVNWQDETGETALHVAARCGHLECARILIQGSVDHTANLELAEKSFAFTPLHIAAVNGHLAIAEHLAESGAEVPKQDSFGWTAKEHAALRGHLDLADMLLKYHGPGEEAPRRENHDLNSTSSSPPETSSLEDRRSNGSSRVAEPIKSFGHRYLTDTSLVLVSLGSMDMRKSVDAVKLERVSVAEAHANQLDTALSVVVSAQGAQGQPTTTIDLPVHDNISTEPILFHTKDVANVSLFFDIVPTYSGNEKNKIGRAAALLSTLRPTIGTKRMNLQGDVCIPILSSTLEIIGRVNFNFLVITPFSHPNMEINSQQTYWKKLSSTMVIGHRGLGKNLATNKSLQLGENTVPSFIAAANLGANYVEFDVQLTKDHVPVIYHDFLVSETGIDAPVHTLTLEQFLHINPESLPRNRRGPSESQEDTNGTVTGKMKSSGPGRQRSLSMGFTSDGNNDLDERMKHTRDFKAKGFKANSRGNFIQAPFATLEDLFKKLPESVGFNIELKYPMLHESEEHEMDTYAVELNSFCDTVLTKVYDMARNRNIIFSSFNPDICLCLSFKQPSIPILFLTDAGSCSVGDVRASSLQEAVRFASRWNLLGIVSISKPFVNSPRLVRVVKQNGLICVSYGSQNNDPRLVQKQVKEGIDAVIVDNVLAIRKGLTKDEEKEVVIEPRREEDEEEEEEGEKPRWASNQVRTLEIESN